MIFLVFFQNNRNSLHTPQTDHASMLSKSSQGKLVARDIISQVGNYTNWCTAGDLNAPVSHHVWTAQVWRHAELERKGEGIYSQLYKPIWLVLHPSLPPLLQEPCIPPSSLSSRCRSFACCFSSESSSFLLSISISDMGIQDVAACLGIEVVG